MIAWKLGFGMILAIAALSSEVEASTCSLGSPIGTKQITTGITYNGYSVSCPVLKGSRPVVSANGQANMHVVTVDLTTPNLSVKASPPATGLPWMPEHSGAAYLLAPVTYVFASGSPAPAGSPVPQVAINANLFTNCCTTEPYPLPSTLPPRWTLLRGFEAAPGAATTPPLANLGSPGFIPYATFASSLVVDGSNRAAIWTAGLGDAAPASAVTAVTGSHQLVALGSNVVPPCSDDYPCLSGTWRGPNARTGVGLKGPSTLVMVVFDGVDNKEGVDLFQFGDLVSQLTDAAINLDGGGSSTMVAQISGTAKILNNLAPETNPRYVGASLWVVAP